MNNKESWRERFRAYRNDGEHASIDDVALNKFDVMMLEQFIEIELASVREETEREVLKRIRQHMKFNDPNCSSCESNSTYLVDETYKFPNHFKK